MKLVRLARNVILARFAWRYIARRRALARQQRRTRSMMIAPILIVGSAGAAWAARRRIAAGARRLLEAVTPPAGRPGVAATRAVPEPERASPKRTQEKAPSLEGGEKRGTRAPAAAGAPTHGGPAPSAKKRRRRVRQQRAEAREKAEQQLAPRGKVNVEINETPELRAPLGDLKH